MFVVLVPLVLIVLTFVLLHNFFSVLEPGIFSFLLIFCLDSIYQSVDAVIYYVIRKLMLFLHLL